VVAAGDAYRIGHLYIKRFFPRGLRRYRVDGKPVFPRQIDQRAYHVRQFAAFGQAPLSKGDVDDARAAFQHLAERTVEDLLLAFVTRQKLWQGNSAEIAAALQSAEGDVRVEALRIVAARSLREEIPTVLRLLLDEDENVRDAALGTLVALREQGTVKVLAESRQMRDAREMRKILDAIATLGGREAQEYLSFVAETHDDEEIRDMAKAAMNRLERRDTTSRTTK